jgi:hypothetical protein
MPDLFDWKIRTFGPKNTLRPTQNPDKGLGGLASGRHGIRTMLTQKKKKKKKGKNSDGISDLASENSGNLWYHGQILIRTWIAAPSLDAGSWSGQIFTPQNSESGQICSVQDTASKSMSGVL